MRVKFSPRFFAMACGAALCAHGLVAQTSIQLFPEVNTRSSLPNAGYPGGTESDGITPTVPNSFSTTTVNLTCSASPIVATLSGPLMLSDGSGPQYTAPTATPPNALQAGGNLLVDNNIIVTVSGNSNTPANVCPHSFDVSGEGIYNENCFNWSGYGAYATSGTYPPGALNGQDPDTFQIPGTGQTVDAQGGVPPIDISSYLASGKQTVTVALTDEGGILTASSMFLTTNCVQGGVTGPATVSGNTFTGDPTTQSQTFNFDTGNNQVVGFTYDVTQVSNAGNGAIPQTMDAPLDPTTFQPSFVPGTSFATSSCLIHTGELLADGVTPACKLYTLECIDPVTGATSGANCPVSALDNEVVKDYFDGPPFSLQNVYTPYGVFHEGIGFLMASETWSLTNGGPCTFDPSSGLQTLPCPQNLLNSFTGPGAFSGKGLTTNPNSTFISIAGVPEDLTSIFVPGEWPDIGATPARPRCISPRRRQTCPRARMC